MIHPGYCPLLLPVVYPGFRLIWWGGSSYWHAFLKIYIYIYILIFGKYTSTCFTVPQQQLGEKRRFSHWLAARWMRFQAKLVVLRRWNLRMLRIWMYNDLCWCILYTYRLIMIYYWYCWSTVVRTNTDICIIYLLLLTYCYLLCLLHHTYHMLLILLVAVKATASTWPELATHGQLIR